MYPPIPMREMSWWEIVLNNPEWVIGIASIVFAIVTAYIIWRQKCVMERQVDVTKAQGEAAARIMAQQVEIMKQQNEVSAHHERIQNRLIRLQHEHEWLQHLNAERGQILKLARQLQVAAGCLREQERAGDKLNWEALQNTVCELEDRLSILDAAAYSGEYDKWFAPLCDYVDAVQKAVSDDATFHRVYDLVSMSMTPTLNTRKALKEIEERYDPLTIIDDLDTAIRMEFAEFKDKWAKFDA